MKCVLSLSLFGALVFASCNNNSDRKAVENTERDSIQGISTELYVEDKVIASFTQSDLSKYLKSQSPELNWNAFAITKYWKDEKPLTQAFEPANDYYSIYGRYLKYSPDSMKFVDLDSYNLDIYKDKSGRLIANHQGPDVEVSLIDVRKKLKTRLVFLGPGNFVEDAYWTDNNNILLVGYQESDTGRGTNAVIWHFNLADRMVNLYERADANWVNSIKGYARKERLKNVEVR